MILLNCMTKKSIFLEKKLRGLIKEIDVYGLLALILPTIFFIILSWPLILHFSSAILSSGGDAHYDIWLFENLIKKNLIVNYPYGTSLAHHILTPPYPIMELFNRLSAYFISSAVARYNLLILLSFPLTSLAAYLIAYEFSKNKLASLIVGIIVAFCPYHLIEAQYHVNIVSQFWVLFFAFAFYRYLKNPGWFHSIVSGILFAVTLLDNYQFGLIATIIGLLFLIGGLIAGYKQKQNISRILLFLPVILVTAGILIYAFAPWLITSIFGNNTIKEYDRNFQYAELSVYSARAFFFYTPPPTAAIFGKYFTQKYNLFFDQSRSNISAAVVYTGVLLPILALIGLALSQTRLKRSSGSRESIFLVFVGILTLIFLFMSFAPQITILGLKIKTPAHYFFTHLPYFRVWVRFAYGVFFSIAILASVCLAYLLKNHRILAAAAIALLIIDFFPKHLSTYKVNHLPAIYNLIPKENCTLAEYPMFASDEPMADIYLLYQTIHHCKLIFGAPPIPKYDENRKKIIDPTKQETITSLKERGANYLVLHQDLYLKGPVWKSPAELNNGQVPILTDSRLQFIACQDEICLYKIN